jgi:hypothetical protein
MGSFLWWARRDSNPQALSATDFKSAAYTNSATRPRRDLRTYLVLASRQKLRFNAMSLLSNLQKLLKRIFINLLSINWVPAKIVKRILWGILEARTRFALV